MNWPPVTLSDWGSWASIVGIPLAILLFLLGVWLSRRRRPPVQTPGPTPASDEPVPSTAIRSIPTPTPEPHFTGRERELDDTIKALTQDQPVLIWGIPGIGKSTLAAQAVADPAVMRHFADGILWFDEVGGASSEAIGDAVARTRQEWSHIPTLPSPAEKELALRANLAQLPLLVVLDNADDPAALRHFCSHIWRRTLATSRRDVADLVTIALEHLPEDKATELLEKEAGRSFTTADKGTLAQVARLLEGHPLALAVAGRQLQGQTPADLLASLRAVPLDTLPDTAGLKGVRRSFESSFAQLGSVGQGRFAALGVFAADFDLAAAQAVTPVAQGHHLADLWGRSLLHIDLATGRYRLHPLLRHYAREKLGEDIEPYRRMADYYLKYAQAHQQDHNALEAELPNLLGAMDEAEARLKEGRLVVGFMDALRDFLDTRGYWTELVDRGRRARAAAQALGDEEAAARLAHNLGVALQKRGEYAEAEGLYRQSLEIKERLGDPAGIALSKWGLAMIAQAQGQPEEAEGLYTESLTTFQALGDRKNIAGCLHQLGVLAQAQGDYPQAEGLYRQSLEIEERLGNQAGIAASLHNLGTLAQAQRDYPQAEARYRQSLEIKQRLGNQAGIAVSLGQLGLLAQDQGDYPQAEALYRQALEIEERLGDQAGIAITLHQLGRLAEGRGDKEEAERLFRQALEIFQRLGSPEAAIARRSLERVTGQGTA